MPTPLFTQKHYRALAGCIKMNDCFDDERVTLCQVLGELFEADNPRFDWERWWNAALTIEERLSMATSSNVIPLVQP